MNRPSVTVRNNNVPGAAADGETIVEFSFQDSTGGLISFSIDAEGNPRVELYRCDEGIRVGLDNLTDHKGGKLIAASDMSLARIGITK
jgi:hypothetical protein